VKTTVVAGARSASVWPCARMVVAVAVAACKVQGGAISLLREALC
jgi:hypothetical protein